MEQASETTSAVSTGDIGAMTTIELSYLPDHGKNLRTVPACLHLASLLLRKTTHEGSIEGGVLVESIE